MKYLIGNWKSNKTIEEARVWIDEVKREKLVSNKNLQVILCPAFIHLELFNRDYPELTLGAQTVSPYPDGTYTGAVSARMLEGLVDYAIVGHSERREHFLETDQIVARQVERALENRLTPLVAVDKTNWGKQLSQFSREQISKLIILYEPLEAISKLMGPIGEGNAEDVDDVEEMIKVIREEIEAKAIIYGGSVKANNIQEYLNNENIDGVLSGSASLDFSEWVGMVRLANQVLI